MENTRPSVILSAIADEAAVTKSPVEQLSVCAALGLQYYTPRSFDFGDGPVNVMNLGPDQVDELVRLQTQYGVRAASLGSPIGKVKLVDGDDGTTNKYYPFDVYMREHVERAILLAHRFETKLLRGFSFYPPRGRNPREYVSQATDWIGRIASRCRKDSMFFGLEVEANLVGQTGEILAEIAQAVNNLALVLIFDAGNLCTQNMPAHRIFAEYRAMKPYLGWMHIKDYRIDPALQWEGHVDEARLKNFVPCDVGDSGHEAILRDFRAEIPRIGALLKSWGARGVVLDLEPHLKGGGQFGGFSGPDGMGVALRALCRLLDYVGIDYHLRDFADIKAARGF